ncbi:MFS transporter [Winogradskyella aurantiaca]|uniref:MFS transporter n=1 Tax=Winogradskyella aurantiaca TaxID=2219558 RepID=UPI000E1DB5E4|nr:MFS transporter [Winogradskyella aurantiaca]
MSKSHILPTIVIAQLLCTSLWFAGNGVMTDLVTNFNLDTDALGHLTAAVQLGFITGTLVFALLTIADRFSPSKVFLISAILGALCNLGILWQANTLTSILLFRFLTGFFLAGIYPVGMKIASDYYNKGLGRSLGFLVSALVLGTASPHLLKYLSANFSWNSVIIGCSVMSVGGGLALFVLVPKGPFITAGARVNFQVMFQVFKRPTFKAAAFGYFGHMWELYAFWAFVPVLLKTYQSLHPEVNFNVALWSFLVIGVGSLSCVAAGIMSLKSGTKKTAFLALLLSCICCLISPLMIDQDQPLLFLSFLIIWGMVVIADSPLFSTLAAQTAPPEIKGTALTTVNSIGFAITIISIQLMSYLDQSFNSNYIYMLLALGPILGLWALLQRSNNNAN